jgi:histone H3/H4
MAKKGIETLVIASKAKGVLKKAGCNTAGDAFMALNGYLYWLLEQAAKRAKANGRKTVRKHDFMV